MTLIGPQNGTAYTLEDMQAFTHSLELSPDHEVCIVYILATQHEMRLLRAKVLQSTIRIACLCRVTDITRGFWRECFS
jgi:hypothetical protein